MTIGSVDISQVWTRAFGGLRVALSAASESDERPQAAHAPQPVE
jgi:hypothetical protein